MSAVSIQLQREPNNLHLELLSKGAAGPEGCCHPAEQATIRKSRNGKPIHWSSPCGRNNTPAHKKHSEQRSQTHCNAAQRCVTRSQACGPHLLAIIRSHARRVVLAVHPAEAPIASRASQHAPSTGVADIIAMVPCAVGCRLEVARLHTVYQSGLVRHACAQRLYPQPG